MSQPTPIDRVLSFLVLVTIVTAPIAIDLADSIRSGASRDAGTEAYVISAASGLILALVLFAPAIGLATAAPHTRQALLGATAWVAAGVLAVYAALFLGEGLGWWLVAIVLGAIAVTTAGAAALPLWLEGRAPGPPADRRSSGSISRRGA